MTIIYWCFLTEWQKALINVCLLAFTHNYNTILITFFKPALSILNTNKAACDCELKLDGRSFKDRLMKPYKRTGRHSQFRRGDDLKRWGTDSL